MKKLLLFVFFFVGCEEPAIEGCMNYTACNYDADATLSIGCKFIVDDCDICGGTTFGNCSISDKAQLNSKELCESAEGTWITNCD